MSLSNLTPVEVDVIYLERLNNRSKAAQNVEYAKHAVINRAGIHVSTVQVDGLGRKHHVGVCVHPACGLSPYGRHDWADVEPHVLTVERCIEDGLAPAEVQALGAAEAVLGDTVAACQECEAEYDSRPWSRYWLVVSSDGHIHRSCHCSTCNKGKNRTQFALAAYLSGQDAQAAVADLGPALCSVCFPEAPVESKEQARISGRLALALAEGGCEAFKKARQEASEKAVQRSADRCPGSGQVAGVDGHRQAKCPVCGCTQRRTSTGKVLPHNAPKYIVRQRYGSKVWTGSAWGTSAKAAIYGSRAEADAVAVQVSTPEQGAEVGRK